MMFSPATHVLVKVFARGFYRANSGLFLFLLITFVSYCFFVQVLNQTHITHFQILLNNLLIVLTLISSPVVMLVAFILWGIFAMKALQFIVTQLKLPQHQFLLYSITSATMRQQLKSWFSLNLIILLPLLIYSLFSLIVGALFNFFAIPIATILFIVMLAGINSFLCYRKCAVLTPVDPSNALFNLTLSIPKPMTLLFPFQILHHHKLEFVITKIISFSLLFAGLLWLKDVGNRTQVTSLLALGVAVIHTALLYQSYRFENYELKFINNLPFNKARIFLTWLLAYIVITLPENIFFLSTLGGYQKLIAILIHCSIAMFFRNTLYAIGADMRRYIVLIFIAFILSFILILFNLPGLLILVSIILSTLLLRRYYRRRKETIGINF